MALHSSHIEIFLARLYTDHELYEQFISDPELTLARENLSQEVVAALQSIDMQGLKLAVNSYHRKRNQHQKRQTLFQRIARILKISL